MWRLIGVCVRISMDSCRKYSLIFFRSSCLRVSAIIRMRDKVGRPNEYYVLNKYRRWIHLVRFSLQSLARWTNKLLFFNTNERKRNRLILHLLAHSFCCRWLRCDEKWKCNFFFRFFDAITERRWKKKSRQKRRRGKRELVNVHHML